MSPPAGKCGVTAVVSEVLANRRVWAGRGDRTDCPTGYLPPSVSASSAVEHDTNQSEIITSQYKNAKVRHMGVKYTKAETNNTLMTES